MSEAVGGIVELSHRTCRVCTNIMWELMRAVDAQAVAKNAPSTPPAPFPSLLLLRLLLAGAGVLFGVFFVCSAKLHGFQDLSSSTRDHTQASAVKAQSPNHWTTREFPP